MKVLKVLSSRGLQEYVIEKENNSWKKYKLFGSLLDNTEDIKRGKTAITAANNIEHKFKNTRIKQTFKIQAFKTYISNLFL